MSELRARSWVDRRSLRILAWLAVVACGIVTLAGIGAIVYTFAWASATPNEDPNQYAPFFFLVFLATTPIAGVAMALFGQLSNYYW